MQKLYTILFKVPELQRKILMTALFLAIYRIGFYIPLPIVDQSKLAEWQAGLANAPGGRLFGAVAMFGGTQIGMSTIFGLGIMPYISASIIFQLLASVVPSLEALMKEGESGRKKINEYTRYATVLLCAGQSAMWVRYMMTTMNVVPVSQQTFGNGLVAVLTMTAGTVFLMWIGEQIDEFGIGNGISLLIMAGILARMPQALFSLLQNSTLKLTSTGGEQGLVSLAMLGFLFIAVVVGVIAMTESQRRIPTQSAKHVRGRRVYGGTRQYLPLKVNQAGVMPIIFASSLLMFPSIVLGYLDQATASWQNGSAFARFWATFFQESARGLPGPRLRLHALLHHPDLLLLLLLDGHHLQPEGHVREPQGLRQLHPRLPPRPPHGRLPRKGHAPHHLRRRGLPEPRGGHPDPRPAPVPGRFRRRQLPRRHRLADRRQCLPRPRPEDR